MQRPNAAVLLSTAPITQTHSLSIFSLHSLGMYTCFAVDLNCSSHSPFAGTSFYYPPSLYVYIFSPKFSPFLSSHFTIYFNYTCALKMGFARCMHVLSLSLSSSLLPPPLYKPISSLSLDELCSFLSPVRG